MKQHGNLKMIASSMEFFDETLNLTCQRASLKLPSIKHNFGRNFISGKNLISPLFEQSYEFIMTTCGTLLFVPES